MYFLGTYQFIPKPAVYCSSKPNLLKYTNTFATDYSANTSRSHLLSFVIFPRSNIYFICLVFS